MNIVSAFSGQAYFFSLVEEVEGFTPLSAFFPESDEGETEAGAEAEAGAVPEVSDFAAFL